LGFYVWLLVVILAMTPRKTGFALETAQSAPERSCVLYLHARLCPVAKPDVYSL